MTRLRYTKNRSWVIEQTFLKHHKPKVGDVVLALDYAAGSNVMTIGRLIAIEPDEDTLGNFRVDSIDWQDTDPLLWQQAYTIPDGVVTVETDD